MDKLKLGWAGAAAKVITENTGKEVTAEDVAVKATVAVNNKKFGADLFVSVAKDVLKKGTPSARFGTAWMRVDEPGRRGCRSPWPASAKPD